MTVAAPLSGDERARDGEVFLEALRQLLPDGMELSAEPATTPSSGFDALWQLRDTDSGVYTRLAVEAKVTVAPRDARALLARSASMIRTLSPNTGLFVLSPWLSSRTRQLLEQEGVNYLDLTGNVYLRLRRPSVYLRLQGSDRSPAPSADASAPRLSGARANRLVRVLTDAKPPYRAKDLIAVTGLSPGYVSRALDALDAQALIQRQSRGAVTEVDWPALLRFRAGSYNLYKSNRTTMFTAQQGWSSVMPLLSDSMLDRSAIAVTGAVAAADVAPLTAPRQLVLYVRDDETLRAVRRAAHLLPTQRGADVVLAIPADASHLWAASPSGPVPRVAPSQVVLDCLAGNGRLPEEGEAVLVWMQQTEDVWRVSSLSDLSWPTP